MCTCQRLPKFCLIVAALSFLAGCNGINAAKHPKLAKINRHMPWYDEDAPQYGVPDHMIGYWTDTVLSREGQKPQRGFGGRILFYGEREEKPILVEGQLVVYAFDEANRNPTDNAPTLRYVFPAEQLRERMSECDMGASYNFWLPWDDVGGPQTDVSLVCRFESKSGAVVMGEQTRHRLKGTMPNAAVASAQQKHQLPEGVPHRLAVEQPFKLPGNNPQALVQQAGFEAPIAPATANLPSYTTTDGQNRNALTIPLPDSMRNTGQTTPVKHSSPAVPQQMPQPGVVPAQLPANGAVPATAPTAGVAPMQTVPGSQIAVPNQAGAQQITPNSAASIRAGGYRLLPQQMGSAAASVPASSTLPPTQAASMGPGNRPNTASGYLTPEMQQSMARANSSPMLTTQMAVQGIATVAQQQTSVQGWNDHVNSSSPANGTPLTGNAATNLR